jgi:hypothetical protein
VRRWFFDCLLENMFATLSFHESSPMCVVLARKFVCSVSAVNGTIFMPIADYTSTVTSGEARLYQQFSVIIPLIVAPVHEDTRR